MDNEMKWGNIGPDSIHDPKWNRKKTKAEKLHHSVKSKEAYQRDDVKQRHADGIKNSEAFQQSLKDAPRRNKKLAKDVNWQKAQREGAIKKYETDVEYNKKRSASLRETLGRKILTPFGSFESPADFKDKKFVKCDFFDNRRMMPHLYYFADEGPGLPTKEKVFVTPYHVYPAGNNNTFGSFKERAYNDAIKYNCVTEPKRNKDAQGWYDRLMRSWQHLYSIEERDKIEWYLEEDQKLNLTHPTAKELNDAVLFKKNKDKENKGRPIQTPHGVFDSVKHACDYYFENDIWPTRSSLGSVRQAFNSKLKNDTENFYLI